MNIKVIERDGNLYLKENGLFTESDVLCEVRVLPGSGDVILSDEPNPDEDLQVTVNMRWEKDDDVDSIVSSDATGSLGHGWYDLMQEYADLFGMPSQLFLYRETPPPCVCGNIVGDPLHTVEFKDGYGRICGECQRQTELVEYTCLTVKEWQEMAKEKRS